MGVSVVSRWGPMVSVERGEERGRRGGEDELPSCSYVQVIGSLQYGNSHGVE